MFSKVQQSLGGRVRFIVSGSAPLAPRVLNFLRAATGAVVLEGYGQTECSAVCSIQLDGEGDAGNSMLINFLNKCYGTEYGTDFCSY